MAGSPLNLYEPSSVAALARARHQPPKWGPFRAGPTFANTQQNRLQNLGLKAAPLLGWSGALGTSGFLG
jgi:hypothetical protein